MGRNVLAVVMPWEPYAMGADRPMSSPHPVITALDALHRSLGATMTDFAGWDMPLRYGSERDEHIAVRTRAGLFDLSHMGEITVTGPQAGRRSWTTPWSATSPPSASAAPATP